MPHLYISELTRLFQQYADPDKAAGAEKYMRNQFSFIGLQTPLRRELSRSFFRAHPIPSPSELEVVIREAYHSPYRELHYAAIEWLAFQKKYWSPQMIPLIEWLLITNSWWDSVDLLNTTVIGPFFLQFPDQKEPVTRKWNLSENCWLQRSSLIFQLLYKEKTDTRLLAEFIENRQSDNEFFIRKAIGWALRQYARTNPQWVSAFVKQHPGLSVLSKKEALKHLK
jgi:3-methyladenine DNA glycosylase AlkD